PGRDAAAQAPPRHGAAGHGQAHARGGRHEDRAPDAVAGQRATLAEGPARAPRARRQRADLGDGDDRGAGGGDEAAAGYAVSASTAADAQRQTAYRVSKRAFLTL